MPHPSECPSCQHLRRLTRQRLTVDHLDRIRKIPVKSWCRICGVPVLLEVVNDYEYSKRNFQALDDQPMTHRSVHAEIGGWGTHWRLDEVLATIFPREHQEECWPKQPWYEHVQSEDQAVTVIDQADKEAMSRHVDVELRMLQAAINREPRTREEIAAMVDQVWDHDEFVQEFDVQGFRAPFVVVKERRTGTQGSALFQNVPRYYFAYSRDRLI